MLKLLLVALLPFWISDAAAQRGSFLSVQEFRQLAFAEQSPQWQTLWIDKQQRADIEQILGRRYPGLRIRYLGSGSKTAWIFEEIGKEMPITIGVVVDGGHVADSVVMEYRESRGGEIRYPFFTAQFQGVALSGAPGFELDRQIDGITGATLSVRAMKKIVRLALYCHQRTPFA